MHIFQVSKKMFYPPLDGESVGIYTYTRAFAQLGHRVTVLAMNTPKHNYSIADVPPEELALASYETVFVNTNLNPFKAFVNLFGKGSYNVERFISRKFAKRLAEYLQQHNFDIIELESSYLIPYTPIIRQHSQAPIVVRLQNAEHIIWQRLADEERFLPKRLYLQLLAQRMKQFELTLHHHCDALLPVSPVDEVFFREVAKVDKPMFLLPFSLDTRLYAQQHLGIDNDFPSLFFLGALDWIANVQGLFWFLDGAWQILHEQHPNLKFYIAGRKMTDDIKQRLDTYPNVITVGEVPNALVFMLSKSIMLVPLLAGSGMRVKIVEGMALGKPIVATSIAAEGIGYTNGKNILIADTIEQYIAAINQYLANQKEAENIGAAAQQFAAEAHDVISITRRLLDFYAMLCAKMS